MTDETTALRELAEVDMILGVTGADADFRRQSLCAMRARLEKAEAERDEARKHVHDSHYTVEHLIRERAEARAELADLSRTAGESLQHERECVESLRYRVDELIRELAEARADRDARPEIQPAEAECIVSWMEAAILDGIDEAVDPPPWVYRVRDALRDHARKAVQP